MRVLRIWLFGLVCWLAAVSAASAQTEKRVALVVGNGAYKHAQALRNAPSDASDMTAKFKALGFETFGGLDLDRVALVKALVAFGRAAERADVAAVFYAGVAVPYMSTHNSWAGSVVVPDGMPLFAHLRIQPDGSYRLVITSGNYDLHGGGLLLQSAGKLTRLLAPLELHLGDNYASERAGLLVTETKVHLEAARSASRPRD